MVYNGRPFLYLFSISTCYAICFDKLLILIVQLKCSSMYTPIHLVNLTCSILFSFIDISALSVLYFYPFGVNIMKCYLMKVFSIKSY